MKIVSNINGNTKTTSYGNKLFYRSSPNGNYTQVKRAFYRSSPNANYTQVYLYDNVAPTITVTSSTATTATAAYTLTATISDSYTSITNIYVNNVAYPFTAGSKTVYLSKAFTLVEGVNYFTIKAIDEAQNIQEITISKTLKIPSGFTTDLTGFYAWDYDALDGPGEHGSAGITATDNNYFTFTSRGNGGGFQHPVVQRIFLQKLIPVGQTNVFVHFYVDGNGQHFEHEGYTAGCTIAKFEIYDINGTLVDTRVIWEGQIIYSKQRPFYEGNISLAGYNDGAHFIRFVSEGPPNKITQGYGVVSAGEWAWFQVELVLSFS